MKLWSIQPKSVMDIVMETGKFRCNPDKSSFSDDDFFKKAYGWIANEMHKRISGYEDVLFPVWAWHTTNGIHSIPNLNVQGLGETGKEYVCIEIEVPDSEVILSDFDKWNLVLMDTWIDDSKTDMAWEINHAWFDSLSDGEQERIKKESWQKIFNTSGSDFVQATFFELSKEMIRNVTSFIAK